MKAFWDGFEKRAGSYDFAIRHHVETLNNDARLKRSKAKAQHVNHGGNDYIITHDPGRKGFLGLGKKPASTSVHRVFDNTEGQIDKGEKSPAVYFKELKG